MSIKKLICILLIISILSCSMVGFGQEKEDKIEVIINGVILKTDVDPMNVNGRVLIPMRTIFEALGAEVFWDGGKKTVIAIKGSQRILLTIGNKKSYINGKLFELDVSAIIRQGRTVVPLRYVSEALGANVVWDNKEKVVNITTLSIIPTPASTAMITPIPTPASTSVQTVKPTSTSIPIITVASSAAPTATPVLSSTPAVVPETASTPDTSDPLDRLYSRLPEDTFDLELYPYIPESACYEYFYLFAYKTLMRNINEKFKSQKVISSSTFEATNILNMAACISDNLKFYDGGFEVVAGDVTGEYFNGAIYKADFILKDKNSPNIPKEKFTYYVAAINDEPTNPMGWKIFDCELISREKLE